VAAQADVLTGAGADAFAGADAATKTASADW
jgi:hypothetical protein